MPYEEALIKAEMMNISCIETSAKTGENINELLQMIIGEIPQQQPCLHVVRNTRKEKILLGENTSLSLNQKCSC